MQKTWDFIVRQQTASVWELRDFFAIRKSDFQQVRQSFDRSKGFVTFGRHYRTRECWLHIHAVDCGDFVMCHRDFGNPDRSIWLVIPHFFFDVLPYLVYCLITLKKPFKSYDLVK